ncbi:hypothetical protein N5863_29025 (plasmid) [Klebsiella pasteurii]|uniref:hypothetical protein n=1 Tax=Klebsiella pasteurii TaxID=2587529 RepID=UPI00254314E3|nr:hypothetical protein [Klebsiella pasteurii]WII85138.1 hypothetical protein N5863_29025 [Klebsiella pasteurii]
MMTNEVKFSQPRVNKFIIILVGFISFITIIPVYAVNKNSVTATFKATILPGTCSVSLNSKKASLDLKSVSSGSIVLDSPLLTSDSDPQFLNVSCDGYPEDVSKPSLTVNGNDIASTSPSLFRDGGDNPSISLGFKVQAAKIGVTPSDWNNIQYLDKGMPVLVDTSQGINANGVQIPIRFSMWCTPQAGKTISDCRSGGKVIANLSFLFDYQ